MPRKGAISLDDVIIVIACRGGQQETIKENKIADWHADFAVDAQLHGHGTVCARIASELGVKLGA